LAGLEQHLVLDRQELIVVALLALVAAAGVYVAFLW